MNAERILIAAECVGDAKWFIEKATIYAKEREVFGRPIGQNQGIQFPIAKAFTNMRAAELMVKEALRLYELGENPGAEANMAKMLAADASFEAANMCIQTYGGFGFAEEFDIERKFVKRDFIKLRRFRLTSFYHIFQSMCWDCLGHIRALFYSHLKKSELIN
jgi:alkylation response protein AidB-like acyl-CoA dehydrogenase